MAPPPAPFAALSPAAPILGRRTYDDVEGFDDDDSQASPKRSCIPTVPTREEAMRAGHRLERERLEVLMLEQAHAAAVAAAQQQQKSV
jgi:hypothetical protein